MVRASLAQRLVLVAGVLAAAAPAFSQPGGQAASHRYGASRPIEGQYVVVFKRDVPDHAALASQLVRQAGGEMLHAYGHALKGFAARLPAAAIEGLRRNPNVELVEQDATVSLNETVVNPPRQQVNPTWGLDRVDQRSPAVNGSYAYQYTGSGVHAFIIDTGILSTHAEFGGRVVQGYTAIADGLGTTDCNGHGTHVAGTVGGATFGVAKSVALVPVRVLGCDGSGSFSGVIAGIDWVAGQSAQRPAVANLSLGGGYSAPVNAAVAGAVAKGVVMAVAAGNENVDACTKSPASEPSAITVGATGKGSISDPRASYSNYGSCLDLFAPGSAITSAWHTGNTATNTLQGTSMATPHVAGVAALALAANPQASPQAVTDFLVANATTGTVSGAGTGSPNRMVYSLASGAPVTPVVTSVSVTGLSGSATKTKRDWTASVTTTVQRFDGSNFAGGVSGATVTGTFSTGGSGSCVTGSSGTCAVQTKLKLTRTSTRFTVTGVSGASLAYDPARNTVNEVTVLQP